MKIDLELTDNIAAGSIIFAQWSDMLNYKIFEESILNAVKGSLDSEIDKITYYAPSISNIKSKDVIIARLKEYIM